MCQMYWVTECTECTKWSKGSKCTERTKCSECAMHIKMKNAPKCTYFLSLLFHFDIYLLLRITYICISKKKYYTNFNFQNMECSENKNNNIHKYISKIYLQTKCSGWNFRNIAVIHRPDIGCKQIVKNISAHFL